MPTSAIPNQADLTAARGKTVPDVIGPGLQVLFCGINPGLYSAAVGHHFARPGNRFWPALFQAGFTGRLLTPAEDATLLRSGYGLTNFVTRATAGADELSPEELVRGRQGLKSKVEQYRPKALAVLGIGAYRTAFAQLKAKLGPQPERLAGTIVWVLPNPSGLNGHYQLPDMVSLFRTMRVALGQSGGP